jgi:hypothetical protein
MATTVTLHFLKIILKVFHFMLLRAALRTFSKRAQVRPTTSFLSDGSFKHSNDGWERDRRHATGVKAAHL